MVHRQEFRFRPGVQQGSAQVANTLLQLASEGGQKLRVYTSYTFSIEAEPVGINENGQIILRLKNPSVSGDTHYGDFSIARWLIPGLADVETELETLNGNGAVRHVFRNLAWISKSPADTVLLLALPGGAVRTPHKLRLVSINFHYPESHLQQVEFLLDAMAGYYNAPMQLERAESLIHGLVDVKPEQVILEEFRLCEAEVIAGNLATASFRQLIKDTGSDPRGVDSRLAALQRELITLRRDFNHRIFHIDSLLYRRGLEVDATGQKAAARDLFERVLVFNPMHVPAHRMIAGYDMEAGRPVAIMERLKIILGRHQPPAQWREEAHAMAKWLFDAEIERATVLADDGRFLDARNVLEKLEEMCISLGQWECPVQLRESLTQVHYGMYRSYLTVARRAYVNGNYPFAVMYGESAIEYQQAQSFYIPDYAEVMQLYQGIVDASLSEAGRAGMMNNFALMVTHLERARELCLQYGSLHCPAGIDNNLAEARQAREHAGRIVTEYVVSHPQLIRPPMNRDEAAVLVREKLSLGHLKAWAGETTEARELLGEISEYALRYNLRSDTLINERMVSLGEMIREKECELGERHLNQLLDATRDKTARGYYTEAFDDYTRAVEEYERLKTCGIDLSARFSSLAHIEKLARYRQLLNEAQAAYFRGAQTGFDLFLAKYRRAGEYAEENQLEEKGLWHMPLTEFVFNSSNTGLIKAAVRFFADLDRHTDALAMLHELQQNRLDAREVRSLQEYAATKAAIFLKNQQPDIQPRLYVREKTANDSWYRYYNRAFISAWGS